MHLITRLKGRKTHKSQRQTINVTLLAKVTVCFLKEKVNRITCDHDGNVPGLQKQKKCSMKGVEGGKTLKVWGATLDVAGGEENVLD